MAYPLLSVHYPSCMLFDAVDDLLDVMNCRADELDTYSVFCLDYMVFVQAT